MKGKKDKTAPKKKPVKPPKEKFGTGENKIKGSSAEDLLSDSVMMGILRKMVPKNLDDLVCEFNYIGYSMQLVDEKMI